MRRLSNALEDLLERAGRFPWLASVLRRRHPSRSVGASQAHEIGTEGHSRRDLRRLIAARFEADGYRVARAGGTHSDGSVDLVLVRGRERTVVQCGHWSARTVGVAAVRVLHGAMELEGATRAVVITRGEFTTDARDFANGRNLELLNGAALRTFLRADSNPATLARDNGERHACPICGSPE